MKSGLFWWYGIDQVVAEMEMSLELEYCVVVGIEAFDRDV